MAVPVQGAHRCSTGRSCGGRLVDSFLKLDPRKELATRSCSPCTSAASSRRAVRPGLFGRARRRRVHSGIAAWLWFTVLFANFAEAMAEGRGKAQADALRKARPPPVVATPAESLRRAVGARLLAGRRAVVAAAELRMGDVVLVEAGDYIPADGEVIEGIASVDESAITGESAPVIRESGGDRSGVTGGTRVLSDWLVVRVTANPGETFLDRMIAMVEGRQAPEDAQRNRPGHPAGGA